MDNTGIIITMAYPETIVSHAEEWYSSFLKYVGVGSKSHVRAGHAALVLINNETSTLEYHDFGRYITSSPNGRVRGRDTDHELNFSIKAHIEKGEIKNLEAILEFLATHPKFTHGEGKLIASVCDAIDYDKARAHITMMQKKDFIRYAAFIKIACNCARFVTDVLIASVTKSTIKKKLIRSKWFTPSTVGNVVIADTQNMVYEVNVTGEISEYTSTVSKDNRRYFLDRLKNYKPSTIGTLEPKYNNEKADHAQWLSGIAAGAWFELYETNKKSVYRFRRVSPDGYVDCDRQYLVSDNSFAYKDGYTFVHYSNCKFFHVKQNNQTFRFDCIQK